MYANKFIDANLFVLKSRRHKLSIPRLRIYANDIELELKNFDSVGFLIGNFFRQSKTKDSNGKNWGAIYESTFFLYVN